MAQSGGYPNNVPPISGSGNSAPGYVINGQPPQWGRPPLASMKPSKPPFNQYSSQSNPASSNGTPTRPHFSNPGSLSSHSSRDPSPIPSNCSDGMTLSQENVVNPNSQLRHSPQQRINTGVPANSMHLLPNSRQMPQQTFVQSKTISSQSGGDSAVNSSPPVPMQFKDGIDVSATISGPRMSTHVCNSQFVQKNSVSPSKIFPGGQNTSLPEATQRHSDQLGRLNQTAASSEAFQNAAMNRLNPANSGGQNSLPSQMYSPPVITSQHSSGFHGGGGAGDVTGPRQANPSSVLRSDSSSLPPSVSQQHSHGTINSRMQGGPEVFSNQVNSNQYMAHTQHPMTSTSGAFPPQVGNYMPGQPQTVSYPYTSGVSPSQQQPQFSASNVISSGLSTSNSPAVSSKSIPSQAYPKPPTSVPYNPFDQTAKPNSSAPYTQASYSSVNQGVRYPHPPSTASQQFGKPTSAAQVSNQMPPPPIVSQNQQFQQVNNPYSYQSGTMGYPPQGPTQNQYQSGPLQPEAQYIQKRYPQQSAYPPSQAADGLVSPMANLSVTQQGFNKLWGLDFYDLLQTRNILPPDKVEPPVVKLHQEFLDSVNCSPEIFRCTLTKIPESNSLLQKSRLPLGILIHPFKDLNHLPVIQCSTIVRCRVCRTYIHPFVHFVDHKHWKCNLCFRVNELPEEFQYDPVSKTYGDPSRRPEVKSSTIEFIAPSEYMLRPPQPAVYLFVLDVSQLAVESGYLQIFCDILLDELDRLPGDGRTQIGFITFDSNVHFYNLAEGLSQPQQMIVVDTDDVFLPCPDNLLVNLGESRELVGDLLRQLPQQFQSSFDNCSALGAALQASYKLMAPTGGRISVFQSCLPTVGPGSLTPREDPNQRSGKDAPHLNPATDFYKLLALDCSGQQVAVDLFLINSQYCDVATISGVSRFSGGCIYHFPLFKSSNILQAEKFERTFRRYLSRKIGFEAVMRIRCSRGLAIHTFHGNFFVRSTDLLSLPNVNPDAGFGMQVSIEENLSEVQNVCFQAALLYTTSKGERRIRVHTLCLPVATTLPDILQAADQQCIVGLLAKMAVDRSHQSSLSDARDAFINVAIDVLSAYRVVQPSGPSGALMAPHNLRLLPLYILALLKYVAFRTGQSTRLDDRLFAMCQMKTLPLGALIQTIYPDLYPVHALEDQLTTLEDGSVVPQPPRLHLSAEKLEHRGAFLLDTGDHMMIYVGHNAPAEFYSDVLGVSSFAHIPDDMYELPVLETDKSENMTNFINRLQAERPFCATLEIIRDDSPHRVKFTERLIEDRTESALSYYEFLQHLKANVK